MAMMSADGLVVAVICGAVNDRSDLRAAAGRGDVDVVQAVQRAREQIDNRNQHRQQPAPVARAARSWGLAIGEHDVTLVAVCVRPSMGAGTVSTRNIVTPQEQMPQQRQRRDRFSLPCNQARCGANRIRCRLICRLRNRGDVAGFNGDDGAIARFHRPLQPFDGFIDPLVVVLGIGDRLFPECICLMKARRSAVHAALPIRRSRPDRILDDRRAGVVNIGQGAQRKKEGPSSGADRLGPLYSQTSSLGLEQIIRIAPVRSAADAELGTFLSSPD